MVMRNVHGDLSLRTPSISYHCDWGKPVAVSEAAMPLTMRRSDRDTEYY
jgi:hypothetical protein